MVKCVTMRIMNIAVLGAHGKSGQVFVPMALAAGHHVRAGVRHVNPFAAHEQLEIISAEATSPADIAQLIAGCDAVVSLIGHRPGSQQDVQTQAMKVLIDQLDRTASRRLISLTGTAVRQPGDKVLVIDHLLNWALRLVDAKRIDDGIAHAEVLQDSDLDWTIVRVLKLTQGKEQPYTLRAHGPARLFTARKTVSRAIIDILEHDSFVREMPVIGS